MAPDMVVADLQRLPSVPREDFTKKVSEVGLVFYETPQPDGPPLLYWPENAMYSFTSDEIDELEATTETLHKMCVEAANYLATGELGGLGLPAGALELVKYSIANDPPSIYGRFDLHYDGTGPAKLFEYNADTPTGLLEAAVAQWYWLQEVYPEKDQWNSIHERLVDAWKAAKLPSPVVHFAHFEGEESGEEWMTVAYLRDTADQAGLQTVGMTVENIGWDGTYFVDNDARPMRTIFKLYPWENMLREKFGNLIMRGHSNAATWIEPVWKVVLSNKALLPALWHLFPDHPNLLPAYMGQPGPLEYWIAKPLHGREGDSMKWHTPEGDGEAEAKNWGPEGYAYQQWYPLPDFDGNRPVLGPWVIDGKPAGLGIRESDGPITDNYGRFVPHVIDAPPPDAAETAELLARDSFQD